MDYYFIGYVDRCSANAALRQQVKDHYEGKALMDKPSDWFDGWNAAEQDNYWSNRGEYQMQFNMLPWLGD